MRRRERRGELTGDRDGVCERDPARRKPGSQVLALEPFHDQVALVLGRAVLDAGHDRGMAQRGKRFRLALESTIVGALEVCRLDRDGRARIAVEATVDDAHAALAREALDLEPPVEDVADVHGEPSTARLWFRGNITGHHARCPSHRRGRTGRREQVRLVSCCP